MQIMVEGVITSIEQKSKDEKKYTELLLAQKGEKVQAKIRIPGHVAQQYSEFEVANFSGRLMTWNTRNGVDMMVMVDDAS